MGPKEMLLANLKAQGEQPPEIAMLTEVLATKLYAPGALGDNVVVHVMRGPVDMLEARTGRGLEAHSMVSKSRKLKLHAAFASGLAALEEQIRVAADQVLLELYQNCQRHLEEETPVCRERLLVFCPWVLVQRPPQWLGTGDFALRQGILTRYSFEVFEGVVSVRGFGVSEEEMEPVS